MKGFIQMSMLMMTWILHLQGSMNNFKSCMALAKAKKNWIAPTKTKKKMLRTSATTMTLVEIQLQVASVEPIIVRDMRSFGSIVTTVMYGTLQPEDAQASWKTKLKGKRSGLAGLAILPNL